MNCFSESSWVSPFGITISARSTPLQGLVDHCPVGHIADHQVHTGILQRGSLLRVAHDRPQRHALAQQRLRRCTARLARHASQQNHVFLHKK